MLQRLFHAWERRLAPRSKDQVVRPFDWGPTGFRRTATHLAPAARLLSGMGVARDGRYRWLLHA